MRTLLASAVAFLCCMAAAGAQTLQETASYIFLPPVEHRQDRVITGPRIDTRIGAFHQVLVVDDKSPCLVELFEEGLTSPSGADVYRRYTRLSLDRMSDWKVDETSGPVHL
jgi:hypothetical protein